MKMMFSCSFQTIRKLFAVLFFLSCAFTVNAKYKTGPVPAWVKKKEYNSSKPFPKSEIFDGYHVLLFDDQLEVERQEWFQHCSYRILNENGVQNISNLTFNYDPSFQTFTFNYLRVIRNGKQLDKLGASLIKELQREEGLEENIYDGTITISVIMKDIRPGDDLEFAYTVKGRNPIFNGMFSHKNYFGSTARIPQYFFSVLVPEGRKLSYVSRNHNVKPVEEINAGKHSYEWLLEDIAPVKMEEGAPSWYDPYPYTDICECNSWQQVEKWATGLFTGTQANGNIKSVLAGFLKTVPASLPEDERIMWIIRYVQNNVRYMALEIGVNSHKPHLPHEVLKQKFGDCKDKSWLLVNLLRGSGVEAWPALVSSGKGYKLVETLPSPLQFNHCIVKFRFNGKAYFVDPTVSNQGGNLDKFYTPNYHYALVIDSVYSGLEAMNQSENYGIETHVELIIKQGKKEGVLSIKSSYTGADADGVRYSFISNSKVDITEKYLKYFREYFPDIETDGEIVTEDDTAGGTFTVFEKYKINKLYEALEKQVEKQLSSITASLIEDKLSSFVAQTATRKMPYSLEHPLKIREHLKIRYPEYANSDLTSESVEGKAFSFLYSSREIDSCLVADYSYDSKLRFVEAEDYKQLAEDIKKVKSMIGYMAYSSKASLDGVKKSNEENESAKTDVSAGKIVLIFFGTLFGILVLVAAVLAVIYYSNKLK